MRGMVHPKLKHRGRGLDEKAIEKAVFKRMNRERAKREIKPLKPHHALIRAARKHSKHQKMLGALTHCRWDPDAHEDDLPDRLAEVGYSPIPLEPSGVDGISENCAKVYGSSVKEVGKAIVRGWMRSPGHRGNILDKDYVDVGIGVAKAKWSKKYEAFLFYATAEFSIGCPSKSTIIGRIRGILRI